MNQPNPIEEQVQTNPATGDRGTPKAISHPDVAELQLSRIQEYLAAALAESDPEVAILGIANSQLMTMLLQLNEIINEVLQDDLETEDRFTVLMRAMDTALRVTRQMGRFIQLRQLMKQARSEVQKLTREKAAEKP